MLNYKVLIGANIGHDESVSVNNVLKEYDDMKEEIKNSTDNYVWCNLLY